MLNNDGTINYAGNVYPESAYTLTKVESADDMTITKYEWSDTENKLQPVYYHVELKQTSYGTGDTTLEYGWEKNADTGRLEFKQAPASL